jgi:hypothetical protein
MKITRGFVAVQPDGQFLYISATQTHVGHRVHISPVSDIDDATVRMHPGPRGGDRKEAAALAELKVTWVPVEVHRNVVLQGYGVADERKVGMNPALAAPYGSSHE